VAIDDERLETPVYWLLRYGSLGPLVNLIYSPWIEGAENIPKTGAAILAPNHLSFIDSIVVPLATSRRVTFLAKSEYFEGKGLKGFVTRHFFRSAGQIPVERGTTRASNALTAAAKVLQNGGLIALYPEGTRSPTGKLYRGRTGVARLALENKVPVIPIGLHGTRDIQPPDRNIPKLGRIGIKIGTPMDFSHLHESRQERETLRSVTDQIMKQIRILSEQEYVDIYADEARRLLATDKRNKNKSEN
jgi:1-acyl-sn-glycerol-3-phosphate acyltransferase